jgi:hypothetical protein
MHGKKDVRLGERQVEVGYLLNMQITIFLLAEKISAMEKIVAFGLAI